MWVNLLYHHQWLSKKDLTPPYCRHRPSSLISNHKEFQGIDSNCLNKFGMGEQKQSILTFGIRWARNYWIVLACPIVCFPVLPISLISKPFKDHISPNHRLYFWFLENLIIFQSFSNFTIQWIPRWRAQTYNHVHPPNFIKIIFNRVARGWT